jgi:hypothetical protein
LSLVIDDLDGVTVERAGALVAREHAAARQMRPELPAGFEDAGVCAATLQRLCDSGHRGLVATGNGRTIAVMTAAVRQHPAGGRYARLPAEGFAVEPDLADPTGVLAVAFGDLASPLIAGGVLRYYLVHAALPRLPEALSNLGGVAASGGAASAESVEVSNKLQLKPGQSVAVLNPPPGLILPDVVAAAASHRSPGSRSSPMPGWPNA